MVNIEVFLNAEATIQTSGLSNLAIKNQRIFAFTMNKRTIGRKEINMLVESLECKIELIKDEADRQQRINKTGVQYNMLRKQLKEYTQLSKSLIKIISS